MHTAYHALSHPCPTVRYALGKEAGWPATNETVVRATADAIAHLGLRDLGYRYVVIDDSWENDHREPNGSLLPNPSKFPSGMAALSYYVR